MARAKLVAALVLLVFAAAFIDGNFTHATKWPAAADPTSPPTNEPAGEPSTGSLAAPLPAGSFNAAKLDDPHHDYPALDIPVPTGTPIRAIAGGRVTWTSDRDPCGRGVIVTDAGGVRWTYCHASTRTVTPLAVVPTGAQIALAGSTGKSSGPHLHLQILAGGRLRCPQPLAVALYAGRPAPDPRQLPTSGCTN